MKFKEQSIAPNPRIRNFPQVVVAGVEPVRQPKTLRLNTTQRLGLQAPYDRDLSEIEYRNLIDRLELNDYVASIERCLGVRL